MSLMKFTGNADNGLTRPALPGDLVCNQEIFQSLSAVGTSTITGALMATGLLQRTGLAANATDTFDTAGNIVAALSGVAGAGIQAGTTFRLKILNTSAFTESLAAQANSGVTYSGNASIGTNASRELLVTIVNGTPGQLYTGTVTNGSNVITGLTATQLNSLSLGMLVSGAAIPSGATITAITSNGTVILSANATATGPIALTFSPVITLLSLGQSASV